MNCHNCKNLAKLKCSKCKKAYYCDAKCQLKHFKAHKPECVGLKVYIYDFEKKGPVLIKDDPNVIGLVSNDNKTFELTREQAKVFGAFVALETANTDSPVKIDAPGKILNLLIQMAVYKQDIYESNTDDDIMETFRLGNYFLWKNMKFKLQEPKILDIVINLSVESFNSYLSFLKNYKKEIFGIDSIDTFKKYIDKVPVKKRKLATLLYENFDDFKAISVGEADLTCKKLLKFDIPEMIFDFVMVKRPDLNLGEIFRFAIEYGKVESAKILIPIENRGIVYDFNLLKISITYGDLDLIKMANIEKPEEALFFAVQYNRKEIFNYLIISKNLGNVFGTLRLCIQFNRIEEFQKLLKIGKVPKNDNLFGDCLIHNRLDLFKMIPGQPSVVEEKFIAACNLGHLEFVKYLIDPEFDIEYAIKRARANNHQEVVDFLNSYGSTKRMKK
jgi:hypothetical protein